MHARRMRHGESFGDHATVTDVDDNAAICAWLPPSIDDVRRRAAGDVADAALLHAEAVEMAAVFGCKLRNEFRLPDRRKGVREARRRKTGIFRVREQDPARRLDPPSCMSRGPMTCPLRGTNSRS